MWRWRIEARDGDEGDEGGCRSQVNSYRPTMTPSIHPR